MHLFFFFFFNDTATTEIYTLSLHDALPISNRSASTPPGACTRIAFILMLSSLPVDRPHSPFRVAVAGGDPFGRDAVDASQVGRSEMNGGGRDVLLQVAPPLGAGDGNDVLALREQPGERELRRRATLL